VAIERNSTNYLYRHFYILFIIVPIVTIYTLSIKSPYSYLDIFSISLPITSPYRLTVVCFYRHLYTRFIWITYNITYEGSLYFGIPGVWGKCCLYKITFIQTEPLEGHQKLNNALDLLMIDPKISPSTSTSSSLGKIQLDWGNGKLSSKPYNSFLSFVCQLANCI